MNSSVAYLRYYVPVPSQSLLHFVVAMQTDFGFLAKEGDGRRISRTSSR